MIKNHTTGRNCQAVILYDSQFTHTIERKRDRKGRRREKKKREIQFSCSEGWSVIEMGISS